MNNLLLDLRYALRNLRKDRRFVFTAILTLALALGACTVVFSIFYSLVFDAFSAKDAGRLVIPVIHDSADSTQGDEGWEQLKIQVSNVGIIREQNHVFENVVGFITDGGIVLANRGNELYQFSVSRVTADAFKFYGVPALLGRGITPRDGNPGAPPVFVMSYDTWSTAFHRDPKIVGSSFDVDGEPRTLVGIMPSRFQAFGPQEQIWIPIAETQGASSATTHFPAQLIARLKPGVSVKAASADLDLIVRQLALRNPNNFPKHFSVRVESAEDSLIGANGGGPIFHSDLKHLLYDLLAAVTLLLFIACVNVANLLLSRATMREHELAVRSALGATRGRLVRQLLLESSVLAPVACGLGCLIAWSALKIIAALLPRVLGASLGSRIGHETVIGLNMPVFFFALAVAAAAVLICGSAPALHLLRSNLQPSLSGANRKTTEGFHYRRFRGLLVVIEVSFSVVLLVGTGLMIRSFFALTHVNLGFNPDHVLLTAFLPPPSHSTVSPLRKFTSPQGQAVLNEVVDRLKALPGVSHIAVEDTIPGYGPTRGPEVGIPGDRHAEEAGVLACDENLLQVLEMRLTSGRWLSAEEVHRKRYVAVINQRLAHDLFQEGNPIGQELKVKDFRPASGPPQDSDFQIIGTVADIKSVGPQNESIPMLFVPFTIRGGFLLLVKTTVPPASLANSVQQQVWAVDRDEIVGMYSPLNDFLQKYTYASPEFGLMISAPLAFLALLLVLSGIFSIMAYTVSLRTREIGIRMALGAQPLSILMAVLRRGALLIVGGAGIGILISYSLRRFISSQIWGISAADKLTCSAVITLMMLAGVLACLLPARRAASVDPMIALREE